MKLHVKKNDLVVVLNGNSRGKRGKVIRVDAEKQRVAVEGICMMKKAVRKTQDRPNGGFLEREALIHVSKVMLAEEFDRRQAAKKKS